MKEFQITTTITVKENGETIVESKQAAGGPDNASEAAAGIYSSDNTQIAEEDAERYNLVSDLANICEYLTDSETIKIRLIINKAQERKSKKEGGEI